MSIVAFDHVLLAIPPGAESQARAFYCELLGFTELPKPAALAGRGGLWLQSGAATLHLGVETDFKPPQRAHPAFLVNDLDALEARLARSVSSSSTTCPFPATGACTYAIHSAIAWS